MLHDAFNSIDMDMSGAISTSELADLLKSMGTRATIEELEDMVCSGKGGGGEGGQAHLPAWVPLPVSNMAPGQQQGR